jgi:hypothetical protein
MAVSGLGCWIAAHRFWLEAGRGLAMRAPGTDMTDDPLVAATVRDWRSCSDALVQAQIDTLESWRQAS